MRSVLLDCTQREADDRRLMQRAGDFLKAQLSETATRRSHVSVPLVGQASDPATLGRSALVRCSGFRDERTQHVIEMMPGACGLGRKIARIVGIHRALQRDASRNINSGLREPLQLCRIIRKQPHARAAERLQHSDANPIVSLTIIEPKNSIRIDGVETTLLQLIITHLVNKPQATPLLLEVENYSTAVMLQL